jgi:hypothetical protein
MLALAYPVKYHIVNVENRVRAPESTNTVWCMVTRSSPFLSERKIEEENFRFKSGSRTMMAYSSTDENTSLRMKR